MYFYSFIIYKNYFRKSGKGGFYKWLWIWSIHSARYMQSSIQVINSFIAKCIILHILWFFYYLVWTSFLSNHKLYPYIIFTLYFFYNSLNHLFIHWHNRLFMFIHSLSLFYSFIHSYTHILFSYSDSYYIKVDKTYSTVFMYIF